MKEFIFQLRIRFSALNIRFFIFFYFFFNSLIYIYFLAMNPVPFQSAPPPVWFPMLPPNPPMSRAFWETQNVKDRLRELQDTLDLAQAMYGPIPIAHSFISLSDHLCAHLVALCVHFVCYYHTHIARN